MIWYVVGLAPLVGVALFTAVMYARRDRGPEPAALESGNAREAVRAAAERRSLDR